MKKIIRNLSTDVNGISEWILFFYVVFPLVGFIASLVYLVRKEKVNAQAAACWALLGLVLNVIFYMIFGR